MFLLFLIPYGCSPCPQDFELIDGECHLSIIRHTQGPQKITEVTADTETPETIDDVSEPPEGLDEWSKLPSTCSTPEELPSDPIQEEDSYFAQSDLFAEMLDIEIDEINNEAWAVGQGGLMRFSLEPDLSLTEFNDLFGARFYHLALGPDNVLYATHRQFGLAVYRRDTSIDPIQMIYGQDFSDLDVGDDRLYITSLDGTLLTYNISDPYDPELMNTMSGLESPWVPVVQDNKIYVADNTLGLVMIDRSNPNEPSVIDSSFDGGGLLDVAISEDGSTAYGAAGGTGLSIYSIDGNQITWLESIPLNHSLLSVDLKGNKLWATSHQDLVLFDISNPSNPILINTEKTEQWAMNVAAWNGDAVVADWGFISHFSGDTSVLAPDIDLSSTEIQMGTSGGYRTLNITNLGNTDLELNGAQSNLDIWFESTSIPPRSSTRMTMYHPRGNSVQTSICLSSNDPDTPEQIINVKTEGIGQGRTTLGSSAPDFTLSSLDGTSYTLSEERGHPVVLIYFATW
ncbi:MAG: hypothetical protein CMK59_12645 [Proteobacteria bacterium]|nr:hypothetical protein [Pseudomonadota bacterium]